FFMKRIGKLTSRMNGEATALVRDPGSFQHQLDLREKILAMIVRQSAVFQTTIRPQLAERGIHLLDWRELSDDERCKANELFRRAVYPLLTPLIVDSSHPFPFLSNLSESLGLLLKAPNSGDALFARVKVPNKVPAWLRLEAAGPSHS